LRTLPIPPAPEPEAAEEKKEKPKRFMVIRCASDAIFEAHLNRFHSEGYELRKVTYDVDLKRGAWAAVLENPSIPRGTW